MTAPFGIVICDAAGRVRLATSEADALLGGAPVEDGADLAEALSGDDRLLAWYLSVVETGTGEGVGTAFVRRDGTGGQVEFRIAGLEGGSESGWYALLATRADEAEYPPERVSRKTWHDIKNQLGGIKLFATFLQKRIGDSDDQLTEVSTKIVEGVDTVVRSIEAARRGEHLEEDEQA